MKCRRPQKSLSMIQNNKAVTSNHTKTDLQGLCSIYYSYLVVINFSSGDFFNTAVVTLG